MRREIWVVGGIVATFALAIGANAAMFGLVGRLLLGVPDGVKNPDRVAHIGLTFTAEGGERFTVTTTSYPAFTSLRALGAVYDATAAVRRDTMMVGQGASLEQITTIQASGDYFGVLGARPFIGSLFSAADDDVRAANPVMVLGYRYWQRHFAGDRGIIGRQIMLDDAPVTVIGVAARGFTGDAQAPVDAFTTLSFAMRNRGSEWSTNSEMNVVEIVARLRAGVAPVVAGPQSVLALRGSFADHQRAAQLVNARVTPLDDRSGVSESQQAKTSLWLLGVAMVVLLIATANVGTLLLLRALRRRREIAVRLALGVSRPRLARMLLTESVMLAVIGGVAGLAVSRWLGEAVRAVLLPGIAPVEGFVDQRVLIATAVATVACGLIAGCAPLVQLRTRDLVFGLKDDSGGARSRRSATRALLVGAQVGLCTVLLIGAGLFVRSLQRIQNQDLGFSTSRLMLVELTFRKPITGAERDAAYTDVVRRLSALPGITVATIVQSMPFGAHHIPPISVPGRAEPPSQGGQLPMMYGATPEFLKMMGVTARDGRLFDQADGKSGSLVVLVNESMARGIWPNESAIGKCIRIGFDPNTEPSALAPATLPCRQIVGVVRDSRARSLRPEGIEAKLMQFYVPFEQIPGGPFGEGGPSISGVLVQSAGDVHAMIPRVQRLVQAEATTPVFARVRSYQDLLDPQMASWRLGATLFSAFGMLALGIAALGLFAVISYLVAQRTHEIGIRLAVGGTGGRIARLVIGDSVRMVATGVVVGLIAAGGLAPFVQAMLFQTSAREATVIVAAVGVLLAAAVCAAAIPAWRASRINPITALRVD
jgi:predicted permease